MPEARNTERFCGQAIPYASWDTLEKQIAAGLHFCASGLPYWTLDIGAFL